MANPLTGDFDAVVQVSVPTVNRLLASMHQNHGNDAGLPTLPHRAVISIGEKPLGGGLAGIKGTARAQIGVPTVALIADEPRSADVSCWIRARYHPAPKAASLPEFIYGKVVARFDVKDLKIYGAPVGIYATASADDGHITFTDSGLNSADSQKVTEVIRDVLRTRITAVLSLLPDVPSGTIDFRGLTDGQGRQAIAFPISLDGAVPGPGSMGQVFLDGSDFAIAVSKEAILALVQPYIDDFNNAPKPGFKFLWGNYNVSATATLKWLTLKISGTAKTGGLGLPNVAFGIIQSFGLTFDAATQSISIVPSGNPKIEQLSFSGPLNHVGALKNYVRDKEVTPRFVKLRDAALKEVNKEINAGLAKAREEVRKLLRKIDEGAEVMIASVPAPEDGVPEDGLLLTGNISLSQRKWPLVEFSKLGDDSGYTAFDSWVPGGRIRDFYWTWWHAEDYVPGQLTVPIEAKLLADRYVLREPNLPGIKLFGTPVAHGEPAGNVAISPDWFNNYPSESGTGVYLPPEGQLCLRIHYEWVDPVTGEMKFFGSSQQVPLHPGIACVQSTMKLPLDFTFYYAPKEFPGPCPDWNVIVIQSAENELVSGSEELAQAIRQAERPDAPVMLILALGIGSRGPSPALAARARELRQRFPQFGIAFADRDAYWLGGLDLPADESRPALRLLDPAGRLVWRHDGVADAATIAAALNEHLVAGPPPRGGVFQARARPGKRPPDFTFEVAPGNRIALRHLRGRRLAIIFVPEGNAGLEAVLSRLSAHAAEPDGARTVVVVQDGEARGTAAAPRGPDFDWFAVPDPERAIARSYGITIRPSAVLVDWDGRVSAVQAM